ncbi:SRPBCC family protein [Acidisphaera rubrifaciens]|uniref:Polyketide cyclase/dehydrase n=1 Tax=Acidisphaera rubrifaciens HS-AP3 TaxID=1231350 RepID=A0A0D6P720_9PROT|nr:SRPBCC family protein [Acidisphaera rubrifaciens]GAN77008.1 hypothetical protein Asru_0218_01 [Acidisphaera rubrifaciens HS-AP3]
MFKATRPRAARVAVLASAFALASVPAWALTTSYHATSTMTPADMWAKVGDFCGIGNWLPPVQKCTLSADGKQRTLSLKGGGEVVEALVSRNDKKRTYTYRILSSPLPVEDYRSTIHVVAKGSGSEVIWSGTYKAKGASDADAEKTIAGIYKAGVDTLVGK